MKTSAASAKINTGPQEFIWEVALETPLYHDRPLYLPLFNGAALRHEDVKRRRYIYIYIYKFNHIYP